MKTRAPWLLVGIGLMLIVPTVWLGVRNGTLPRDPFIMIAIITLIGWAVVGAVLASKNPGNPIGWLMIAFGLGFLVGGFSSEWSTYAYTTNPGALPLREFWAWLSNWWFFVIVTPIPLLLLLYPTGRVRSKRWKPLLWAVVGLGAVATLASMLKPGHLDIGVSVGIENPTGVEALRGVADAVLTVVGILYIVVAIPVCVVAVVVRFRGSSGEERQQMHWLAYVTAVGGVAFTVGALSGIGLDENESNPVNTVAFFMVLIATGLGIPAAIGVALLKYRLWDLDVVLKKTLVAAILVVLIAGASLLGLVLLSAIALDVSAPALVVGLAIGALGWPLLRLARRVADRLVYGGRATPYEILTGFSGRMAESYSTDDILPSMASIVGAGTGAETVTIWLLVGGELRPAAGWPGRTSADESRPTAALFDFEPETFEVRHQGELLGAITVRMPANDPMNSSKERLIRDLASQAGLVLRNVRLIEELRQSRRRIVAAVDEGRRRLERNIHDGAQQQLVALSVKIRLADSMVDRDPERAHELLAQLQAETTDALENLRDLARGIYPPLLQDEGLAAALTAQARRSPIPVRVSPNGIGRYSQDVEATVYFCVLEALSNVTKYANALGVDVELRREDDALAFEVRDDGVGFDRAAATHGTGLQGMMDRVEAIGGRLDVRSAPGAGTIVVGRVPVGAREER